MHSAVVQLHVFFYWRGLNMQFYFLRFNFPNHLDGFVVCVLAGLAPVLTCFKSLYLKKGWMKLVFFCAIGVMDVPYVRLQEADVINEHQFIKCV